MMSGTACQAARDSQRLALEGCAWQLLHTLPALSAASGMTVCLLDVGGGTADITVHDVQEQGERVVLAEAVHAAGALAGSVYVDEAFR
jgi:hypothetical protein